MVLVHQGLPSRGRRHLRHRVATCLRWHGRAGLANQDKTRDRYRARVSGEYDRFEHYFSTSKALSSISSSLSSVSATEPKAEAAAPLPTTKAPTSSSPTGLGSAIAAFSAPD